MYCKNCGNQMDDLASICVRCGVAKGNGTKYCNCCGKETQPQADVCLSCGNLLKRNSDIFSDVEKTINDIGNTLSNTVNGLMNADGYAMLSLILGVIALIGAFVSLTITVGFSVSAILLGKKSLNEKTKNIGTAKAGIILAIAALLVRVVITILILFTFMEFGFFAFI